MKPVDFFRSFWTNPIVLTNPNTAQSIVSFASCTVICLDEEGGSFISLTTKSIEWWGILGPMASESTVYPGSFSFIGFVGMKESNYESINGTIKTRIEK